MQTYLIAIITISCLIVLGIIIFVSVYFTLGSNSSTPTPISNVTIIPTEVITPSPTPFDGDRMKVLLPLYIYPPWDSVLVENNPENLIAIMNPNSGPGDSYDSEYANAVSTLQGSGSNVLGYVATNYASNSNISNLLQQVSNYNSWYGVNGIFYDEMSTSNSNVSFYQNLYDQTKVVLEKTVNGNANIDTYADLGNTLSGNSWRSVGVIHNNVMYVGISYNIFVVDVSNVSPNYAYGPYLEIPSGLSRNTDYISHYGNIYYNTRGYFYAIDSSNFFNLTLLGNIVPGDSASQLVCLNDNQTVIYYSNDLNLLRSVYLSNFQTYSSYDPINGTKYINYFDDTLILYGTDEPDILSNSNLFIFSGASEGNLVLQNRYANFFNNLNTHTSLIDKNGTYFYAANTNLFVCKLGSNYTINITSFFNIPVSVANVTNDAEYLFVVSGNSIQLYKANLDIPYYISNYNAGYYSSSLNYTFCYNDSTSSIYYLALGLKNNVVSNIFSNNNRNSIIVGNPGTNTIEEYEPTADILVVYEGSNFSEYLPNSWQSNYSKNKFAGLVYNSNETQVIPAVSNSNQSLGSFYVTDDVLPNPWDTIPSYYSLESNLINNNIIS